MRDDGELHEQQNLTTADESCQDISMQTAYRTPRYLCGCWGRRIAAVRSIGGDRNSISQSKVVGVGLQLVKLGLRWTAAAEGVASWHNVQWYLGLLEPVLCSPSSVVTLTLPVQRLCWPTLLAVFRVAKGPSSEFWLAGSGPGPCTRSRLRWGARRRRAQVSLPPPSPSTTPPRALSPSKE